ncbi:NAD(+) synthase [Mycoplasmopsis primatum]|uniref:NAD(+) synthase n=1 Tax=Mycoplasmopsis primatum TaxID=55604 RepID=UPI000494DE2D|nr:NAD(+) synthase [Mycoplasmopsis primatum]
MIKRVGLRFNNSIVSPFNSHKVKVYADYLIAWIRQKVKSAKCNGCVVGVSGGIDSALTIALCAKAFPNDTLGIVMPIDNMDHEKQDIDELAQLLGLKFKTVDLAPSFNSLKKATSDINNNMAISNIKPRLRMATLYAYAQQNKYLVVGTDNEDEYFIGYFTKYGDGGVDILPLSNLLKSEVRELAKYLKIPINIINKKPSAGLWEGQSDEDELGFTYTDLDKYLMNDVDNINLQSVEKIKKMNKASSHKRNLPSRPYSIDEYFKINRKKKRG